MATTNGRYTMEPHFGSVRSALRERFPEIEIQPSPEHRFSLENGAEFLLRHFDRIELRVRRDAFRFPASDPWAAYLKSGRQLMMPEGHTDDQWADVSAVIDRVAGEQSTGGELVVPKLAGAFLCTIPAQDHLRVSL